jgi:hypothetical protein
MCESLTIEPKGPDLKLEGLDQHAPTPHYSISKWLGLYFNSRLRQVEHTITCHSKPALRQLEAWWHEHFHVTDTNLLRSATVQLRCDCMAGRSWMMIVRGRKWQAWMCAQTQGQWRKLEPWSKSTLSKRATSLFCTLYILYIYFSIGFISLKGKPTSTTIHSLR